MQNTNLKTFKVAMSSSFFWCIAYLKEKNKKREAKKKKMYRAHFVRMSQLISFSTA